MESITIVKSILYFLIAGVFEIGGGYLIWLWIREGKPITYAFVGAVVLL
jgi:small multidrug resistance family-3 protein